MADVKPCRERDATDPVFSNALDISSDAPGVEFTDVAEPLLYNVSDRPPIHMTFFFAFQQVLVALSGSLAVSSFVADVACASEFSDIKTDLLSSTLLMNGVTTLLMVTLGARLPLFQGAASDYVVPLLAIQVINKDFCTVKGLDTDASMDNTSIPITNATGSDMELRRQLAFTKLQEFQGCLILVGIIHCLVGLTGICGLLLKFIGPVTIVPAILLSGIFLSRATAKFGRAHWGMAAVTAATSIILSLYIGHKKMPFPAWSRKRGFFIYWYPFHQVFSLLIGILVGWLMSALMTWTGALTDDQNEAQYMARVDAQSGVIKDAHWFRVPYPGQFGAPSFHTGVFVAFLIATITSILDSIGDYYACARVCNVPPPPRHAINRGIAIEGFASTISGILGCGHATTTNGGSIGAVGVTKVASRDVFVCVAVIYIVFGLVGKVSAVFITIPQPVLGGAMIVMFGMFNGIVLSNLQVVSLSSTRNIAIIGTSLLVGLMVPYWLETFPDDLNTGNAYNDNTIKTLLANPNLCGGVVACFLDNTVPGTLKERGITAWLEQKKDDHFRQYSEGKEVYLPLLPASWFSWRVMKYLPFCLYRPKESFGVEQTLSEQPEHHVE
ncbi:solute carrier family 23 member 2-like isoform X2 [Mizuhopecten yessoensis]|uniref:Solute carrier family 23 member 2 n=2 Tax=Mizuhopecten yessoensis TaxID=6573 RepID=A0A210PGF0_MIZYE|nr:solute carrier family 23 member 2-like isoform X2 [Mizuhopecten yessoensis]XP_021342238.1 solute carrier family 23 member 2-like isoform X2 [Mizuhopecten yessoensis]XP_021342239.1 solute carrier family 23 member 2-like isoform X2 [Mizuhopecten yessoensis]OWF35568.1 Solute carrier family 23 member 2 [Mizuhopecten yessoensis]